MPDLETVRRRFRAAHVMFAVICADRDRTLELLTRMCAHELAQLQAAARVIHIETDRQLSCIELPRRSRKPTVR